MKKFSMIGASVIAVAAIILTGCDSNKKTHADSNTRMNMGAMNDKCPISGQAVDHSVKCASFEGHDVGFCCGQCQAKWDGMSKTDKEAWVAKCMNMKK